MCGTCTFFSLLPFPHPKLPIHSAHCSQKPLCSNLGIKHHMWQTYKITGTYIYSCIQQNSFNLTSDNSAPEESSPKIICFSFYQKKVLNRETGRWGTCSKMHPSVSPYQLLQ
jgi:hypothetical protein